MSDFNGEFQDIRSTNLISAGYDEASQTARIKFKNGEYEYPNFSPELWKDFSATFQAEESTGKFFAAKIRPMTYKKL